MVGYKVTAAEQCLKSKLLQREREKKDWREMHQNEQRLSPEDEISGDSVSFYNFPLFNLTFIIMRGGAGEERKPCALALTSEHKQSTAEVQWPGTQRSRAAEGLAAVWAGGSPTVSGHRTSRRRSLQRGACFISEPGLMSP